MPRLKIFGKFKGPIGWRKRAEAEELNERNVFAAKFGILDPEAPTPGKQEREVFAEILFVETDADRTEGFLRMRLPDSIEPEDFVRRGRWIEVRVPYREEES